MRVRTGRSLCFHGDGKKPPREKLALAIMLSIKNIEQVITVAKFIKKFSSKEISSLFINDRNDRKVDRYKKILFDNISCNESYEKAVVSG